MFILNHNGREPLYVQLYEQIKGHVLSGKIAAGTKLPSVRELAEELSIGRNTVETTYHELYAEGFIQARPRSGYFVSLAQQGATQSPPANTAHAIASAIAPAITPAIQAQPACVYDFHPARLDQASFPAALWRKYAIECLREHPGRYTQYSEPQGEWKLRCNIRRYLERSRGVTCTPEQVVICSGLQQSLDIVAQLLKDRHPRVAVEDPGYPLPRSVFQNHLLPVVYIPVGPNGIDLDALARSESDIVYITPSHQFPLGHVVPIEHRLKLLDWAESGGKFIIEDDYDSELRYRGKPIPSLQGLNPRGNIVYVGTFSKVLSPALRVSYMVLPLTLLDRYRSLFREYVADVSLLEQQVLSRFMENGHFDKHIRRMRTVYAKRHNTLLNAIERHFGPKASVAGQGAGLHIVLQLHGHPNGEQELLAKAVSLGIRLFPFSQTRADGGTDSGKLLLGFGAMTAEEIEGGIALLSSICP